MLVAQGKFSPSLALDEEIQFDFDPLNPNNLDSIPADLYFDARHEDCWDQQSHCSTITEDQYRPDLILPKRVWTSHLSLQYNCPYVILPDPPVVLSGPESQGSSLPEPTLTIPPFGTKSPELPSPGQNVRPSHPLPTGSSQSEDRAKNQIFTTSKTRP